VKINGEISDYKQSGANGAAMRVLPIALANLGNIDKLKEEIFCNSIITHGHPRAILGAMLYGYAINQIIVFRPEDFKWENYLTQIGLDFPDKFDLGFTNRIEIREWLKEWNRAGGQTFESVYAETINEAQNQLRYIFQSIKLKVPLQDTLKKLGCFDSATKGSGIVTVIAAIYITAKFYDNPIEAIIESVNALGSDTDSIAAFVGGLLGALHGQNIIPEKWKVVQDYGYLDEIAQRLLAISEGRQEDSKNPGSTNFKLLNHPSKDDYSVDEQIEFIPLGKGKITHVERQSAITKGKYNLLIEADFEIGQSILVSKLLDEFPEIKEVGLGEEMNEILNLSKDYLRPKALEMLNEYLIKHRVIDKDLLEMIVAIVQNKE